MATFSVRFLGCKVSYADAQAVRERLLGDGHVESQGAGDVAVVNTCCVTHEAVSKSRQAVSRAAKSARPRVRHGVRRESRRRVRRGGAERARSSRGRARTLPAAVAGDVGAIGCVQADARLERTRAFVKIQDGCSFSCAFCVIPLVRGATRSRRADAVLAEIERRVDAGSPRDRPHRREPRAASATARPGTRCRASSATRGDPRRRAAAALVDRGEPPHRRARRRAPRDARRHRATSTSRCSPATTACSARCAAATRPRSTSRSSSRSATSTSRPT